MIDGALGMAYGVSTTTLLLTLGVSPAAASASVHLAETFTTALSGASHFGFGNVNWFLVKRLIIPGIVGAVIGAYILSSVEGDVIKPFVS
ncbi:MAG: sulfite exporter TauE/SafE family protein, partial [Chloroflexi bacterium]|nr:sulfite exporter TauE/SafE family protein [Chloroflexota bacterium]